MGPEKTFTQDEVREIVDRMARTLALLYAHLGREVVEAFGVAGEEAIRRGVIAYGEARGRRIRDELQTKGIPLTVQNLSRYYDLPLPLAWVSEKVRAAEDVLEKKVTSCPFAEEWKRLGEERLGLIYCEQDRSMREAYNPELAFTQCTNVLNGDPHCHTTLERRDAKHGGAGSV
jgi:hypothetical protein